MLFNAGGLSLFCLGIGCAFSQAIHPDWRFNRLWMINTTASGANVSGTVTHIPVVVRLKAGNFDFTQARDHGEDIRFFKLSGVPIPFQIERWDKVARVAEIWIKMDTVFGNRVYPAFSMVWGNASAPEAGAPSQVFDTADGYAGVWHLSETGNTDPDGYRDATSMAANGQGKNLTAANATEGIVGTGHYFHPNRSGGQSIMIKPLTRSDFDFTGPMALACWIKLESKDGVMRYPLVGKGEGAWRLYRSNAQTLEFCVNQDGKGPNGKDHDCVGTGNHFGGPPAWAFVVGVNEGSRLKIYINGLKDGDTATYGTPVKNRETVWLGENNQGGYFRGYMDEVQILRGSRNADWVKLSFESQRTDGKLLSYSASAALLRSGMEEHNRVDGNSMRLRKDILGRGFKKSPTFILHRERDLGPTFP